MNVLITAGNTQVLIDKVRCLTNIFTGRTGASIAVEAYRRGHRVTLLTSHPETALETLGDEQSSRWNVIPYRTFDELRDRMRDTVRAGDLDAILHSAAVSDYLSAGVFAPADGTSFDETTHSWHSRAASAPALLDRAAGKVKSAEPELWLRLTRAPKLVDKIRGEWNYAKLLVKFKLEVGISEAQLLDIAEKSRTHSKADMIVANTLEGASSWAFIGPAPLEYVRVTRAELPSALLDLVEQMREERSHG